MNFRRNVSYSPAAVYMGDLLVYAPYTLWELLFKINCSAFGNVSLQNMTEPNAGKRGIGFKKPTVIGIKNASSPVFRVS